MDIVQKVLEELDKKKELVAIIVKEESISNTYRSLGLAGEERNATNVLPIVENKDRKKPRS